MIFGICSLRCIKSCVLTTHDPEKGSCSSNKPKLHYLSQVIVFHFDHARDILRMH